MEDAGGLYARFKEYVKKHSLIRSGDQVTVGVSGGPDSVCLLFLLAELRKHLPFGLQVLHVNHMLRPSAPTEASYVDKLCKPLGLRCITVEKPVDKLAKKWKISLEEAGRRVRYEALRAAAREFSGEASPEEGEPARALIACAHHRDDQAETFLFRVFRGSGPLGLAGMRPVEGDLIRPLLFASRTEILEWLKANNLSWCNDESNEEELYTRNRIRLLLLPEAERLVNRQAGRHTALAAEKLGLLSDYLKAQASAAFDECLISPASGVSLRVSEFTRLHPAIRPYVLMEALVKLHSEAAGYGGLRNISEIQLRALEELFFTPGKRSVCLPGKARARRESTLVRFFFQGAGEASVLPFRLLLRDYPNPFSGPDQVPNSIYKKYFDYDKINSVPALRTRAPGDYLYVELKKGAEPENLGKKPLRRLLIDEKVPSSERERIPLLCDGSHVLWAVGLRISAAVKVSERTERILEAEVCAMEENTDYGSDQYSDR